jgi:NADH dehydrogenase
VILVVGGTGHLGRRVVPALLAEGHQVRVMAKAAGSALDLAELGAELFPGDIRDRERVFAAFEGVTVCVSAAQGLVGAENPTPAAVDRDGNRNVTDAAATSGAAVVLLSAVDASPDHPLELQRMKWAAEEYLRASGVPWTIIRGTVFAETWGDILRASANSRGRVQVFGRGENPTNFVRVDDVAAAVVRAVTDPSLRGHTIEVGGPQDLTFNDFARGLTGHEPRHVPRIGLRVMGAVAGPVKPQLARLARAALHMDTADMTFDTRPGLTAYPWLTSRPVAAAPP